MSAVSILANAWEVGGATVGGMLALVLAVIALVYLFRDSELSGGTKAMWVVLIVLFPILGPIVYFAVRSDW
jgi:Na+/melibiose symporter-like transporter